jgi:hypothetical protein
MSMFRAILVSTAMIGLTSVATAQSGTPEEQAACRVDVRKFCYKVKEAEGTNAYLQCLQEHRAKLSASCRAVLENHGV